MSATALRPRDDSVDVARGIAILFVVSAHCEYSLVGEISSFLFVMPLFYFISGFFLHFSTTTSLADVGVFLGKKARRLLLPFALYMLLFGLLTYLFQFLAIPWGNPEILDVFNMHKLVLDPIFSGWTYQIASAMWYIPTLFIACVILSVLEICISIFFRIFKIHIPEKMHAYMDISLFCICVYVYYLFIYSETTLENNPYGYVLKRSSICLCFCLLGYLYYKYKSKIKPSFLFLISVLLYAFLSIQYDVFKYYHMTNFYGKGLERDLSLPYSLAGIGMSIGAATFIARDNLFFKKDGFLWLGKNSLHIMALHLTGFVLLSLIVAVLFPGKHPGDIVSICFRYPNINWLYFFFSLLFCAVSIRLGRALKASLPPKIRAARGTRCCGETPL